MSLFVTFEGADGIGKSTICSLIYEELKKRSSKVMRTREPGGTKISEAIRDIILDNENKEMDIRCEALLYAASRAQHVYEKIRPALNDGYIVLCERYVLSSIAYQAYGRDQRQEDIFAINDYATGGLKPDINFIFQNKEDTHRRKSTPLDRLEKAGDAFHEKVREYYRNIEKKDNYYFIDASQSIEKVYEDTLKILESIGGLK